MKNRKLLLIVSLALAMMMSLGGTLAYLTDTDADVNTMVLGNVKIVQNEQQRNEDGELVEFVQDKPLLPAVYEGEWIDWAPATDWVVADDEAWKVVKDNVNVLDKFVTVTNEGNTPAYVRTLVAFEGNADDIHFVANYNNVTPSLIVEHFDSVQITIGSEDVTYSVVVFTYPEALGAKETTIPSLKQVYLDKNVDNDQLVQYGETYDILVISQAVQASGFTSAAQALNAGFNNGEKLSKEKIVEWFEELYNEDGSINQDMIGSPSNDGINDKWPSNNPPAAVEVEGNNKAAVLAAIEEAKPGDVVKLTEDTTIAGYEAANKLIIDKAITLDLNGKTLTTECGWGGIDLKGGASIINGTINHTGNTAAIKGFQAEKIENVTINVTETDGKTKGGIVVQNEAGNYVGTIKNVTIKGATNGIECYRSTNDPAIGVMDNVTIDATQNGIYLNGAGIIGSISNSNIHGGSHGINAYLANLWHISLDIKNSTISGGNYGIDIWDESATNTGSTIVFNYDDKSTFAGDTDDIKVTLQKEITCTINGAKIETPCDNRINID